MKTKDAHELLLSLSRVPGEFYRDTVLLLETLDKIRNGKMQVKAPDTIVDISDDATDDEK